MCDFWAAVFAWRDAQDGFCCMAISSDGKIWSQLTLLKAAITAVAGGAAAIIAVLGAAAGFPFFNSSAAF